MAVTWITSALVREAMGRPPLSDEDEPDYWLEQCTDAANDWCFKRRAKCGYTDAEGQPPDESVRLGTVLYAVGLFEARGSVDEAASFAEFGGGAGGAFGSMGQVKRLLGINRVRAS